MSLFDDETETDSRRGSNRKLSDDGTETRIEDQVLWGDNPNQSYFALFLRGKKVDNGNDSLMGASAQEEMMMAGRHIQLDTQWMQISRSKATVADDSLLTPDKTPLSRPDPPPEEKREKPMPPIILNTLPNIQPEDMAEVPSVIYVGDQPQNVMRNGKGDASMTRTSIFDFKQNRSLIIILLLLLFLVIAGFSLALVLILFGAGKGGPSQPNQQRQEANMPPFTPSFFDTPRPNMVPTASIPSLNTVSPPSILASGAIAPTVQPSFRPRAPTPTRFTSTPTVAQPVPTATLPPFQAHPALSPSRSPSVKQSVSPSSLAMSTPSPVSLPNANPTPGPTLTPPVGPSPDASPTSTPNLSPVATPGPALAPTSNPSISAPKATLEPSPGPTPQPSPKATPEPSPKATPQPSPGPTPQPSPKATPDPSSGPTPQPSPGPTPSPTQAPSPQPTKAPTFSPTPLPAPRPTPKPSVPPTPEPTVAPTPSPTPFTPVPITPAPTSQPTPPPETLEFQQLRLFLSVLSHDRGEALQVPGSPQFQALNWLANEPDLLFYTGLKKVQRFVLATLYFSTSGDGWVQSDGWLSTADECTWHSGLSAPFSPCTAGGQLTNLDLRDNGLSGSIPPELALLKDTLQRVHLLNNSLGGTLPTELGDLSSLVRFQATRNNLMGGIPSEFGNLSNLCEWLPGEDNEGSVRAQSNGIISSAVFGLGRNNLSGTLPTEMGRLASIDTLGLERNPNLWGSIPTEFGRLTTLRRFALDFTLLSGTVPSELGLLTSLEKISFEETSLNGSIPNEICNLGIEVKADCVNEIVCTCCFECCFDGVGCIPG